MNVYREKPSRHYIAKAVPFQHGFAARFAVPGLFPRLVAPRDRQNDPNIFETEAEAEVAAMVAVFGILNKPRETQKRGKDVRYQKLTGPELAVLLAEANIGLSLFSWIYGTSPDRAQSWIDGVDGCPHPVRVLLEIFKRHPEMVDIAEEVTTAVTTERRPQGGQS